MKVDARLRDGLEHAAADARAAEEVGYDGAWHNENRCDPFPPLAVAADHTDRLELGPAVAIAFARTPMTVAYQAIDLQRYSGGRLVLGLGSQVRAHVERRFSMPWSHPAARMREFVLALRAIWDAWETGAPLAHRGEFYEHSLMPPAFVPPANPFGPPPVYLAAVGPRMLEVCAEVADGFFVHPFCTERYLREVIVPTVAAARPVGADELVIALTAFVALDEADREAVRRQIAFYGSTPAYRPVLDLHGWGDLHPELNRLSKRGAWDAMAALVPDEVVDEMCVAGSPAEVAAGLQGRYAGLAHRLRLNRPGEVPDPTRYADVVDALRDVAGSRVAGVTRH